MPRGPCGLGGFLSLQAATPPAGERSCRMNLPRYSPTASDLCRPQYGNGTVGIVRTSARREPPP